MLRQTGYQEKFELIKRWMDEIIEVVKKDLKQEHLKIDRKFCQRYFLGKNPIHVQVEEMSSAYLKDIAQGNVGLGEFIASRWLLKHADLYGFFEHELSLITTDFEKLEHIDEAKAIELMERAIKEYGAVKTYLFCIFNSVVFPETIYSILRGYAEKESDAKEASQSIQEREESIEKVQRNLMSEIGRYEKKLNALQKKYIDDTDRLKRQIKELQKKMSEKDEPCNR